MSYIPPARSALWIIVGGTPLAAVIALRTLAGVGGPHQAVAASDDSADTTADEHTADVSTLANTTRIWVVPPAEAARLRAATTEQIEAWTAPLFPGRPDAATAAPEMAPSASVVPTAPAMPSGARYAELFRVSSLMTTRDGPVAVIDKKLRRIGDDLGEGITVEAIDLTTRVVLLRTADGYRFERRPSR